MGWIVWEEISVWPAAAAEQLFFQRITFVLRDIPENSTSRFIPFIPNFLVGCQWMMKEGVKWQPHFLLGEERAKVWGLPDLKQQIWLYREDKHKWISKGVIFFDFTTLNRDALRAPNDVNTKTEKAISYCQYILILHGVISESASAKLNWICGPYSHTYMFLYMIFCL